MTNGKTSRSSDQQIIYIFGRIEQWLEDYARGQNLSASELAGRVGTLLCAQAGGSLLGSADRLPGVPQEGSGTHPGLSPLEVAVGAPGRAQELEQPGTKIRTAELERLRSEVQQLRAAGVSWDQVSQRLGRSERSIKRAVGYVATRSYNGTHWMQQPANRQRVMRAMRDRRRQLLAIAKKAGIDKKAQRKLSRAEWWRRYRAARDKGKPSAPKSSRLSPQGRERLSEVMKARWKKWHATGGKSVTVHGKRQFVNGHAA